MNNTFKKEDLKAGMVVELLNNNKKCLAMIYPYKDGLCISSSDTYMPIESLNNNLESIYDNSCKINKIYGLSNYTRHAYKLSDDNRELLWERKEEPEYMTFWEAKKYNFIKHKDIGECRCLIGKTDDVISVGVVLLKDLDKKVWIGANKFIK